MWCLMCQHFKKMPLREVSQSKRLHMTWDCGPLALYNQRHQDIPGSSKPCHPWGLGRRLQWGLLNPSWTLSKNTSGAKGKPTLMLAPKLQRCICLVAVGSQDTTNRSNRSPWIPPMRTNHHRKPNQNVWSRFSSFKKIRHNLWDLLRSLRTQENIAILK